MGLDDVVSAVDAHVASWILSNVILSSVMNQKTYILCTHNIQAIFSADMVVIMDKGQVKWSEVQPTAPDICSIWPMICYTVCKQRDAVSKLKAELSADKSPFQRTYAGQKGPEVASTAIGQGNTTTWKLCGLDKDTCLTVFFDISSTEKDPSTNVNPQLYIQTVTRA